MSCAQTVNGRRCRKSDLAAPARFTNGFWNGRAADSFWRWQSLEIVLDSIVIKRPNPPQRRHKHLCADAAYTGASALQTIHDHGYITHVKGRGYEANELRHDPRKRARRWVVEVAHSWFNRFRKLLVRHEKLERSFLALNHLAAAIIAFRKVPLMVNIDRFLVQPCELGQVVRMGKEVQKPAILCIVRDGQQPRADGL